ncbi:MAG: molybdopterin-dependent oxidoreductase [Coriobacteriia bacterium]
MNHAMKRIGKKGEDKWEIISYEQALDEIAEKLQKLKDEYGPETLVSAEGTYRSDHLWARSRFSNLFGNPSNILDPGTICWCWTYTVNMSMVGWPIESTAPPCAPDASTAVIWGKRPDECYGIAAPLWRSITASLEREDPAKLITVDPVCTETARLSDVWLQVYPGTDLIVMLAWLNYIIGNELYQKDFVKDWSNGVFLIRKSDNQMLRASDVVKDGKREDFVAWNDKTGKIVLWNSDEGRYFEQDVDTPISGDFNVTLTDGSTVACRTAWDAVCERISEYTVERASKVSGVPEAQIIQAAYTYATNGPAYICWGLGGGDQHGINASSSAIAKTLLRCICGHVDVFGGEYIGEPGPVGQGMEFVVRDAEFELSERVLPETRTKMLGYDINKVMSWQGFEPIDAAYRKMFNIPRPMLHQMLTTPTLVYDAILEGKPYPVKAMIAWSSNPMAWAPNTKRCKEALEALELLVVLEYWKTPTALLADYILPAADSLERPMATAFEDSMDFFSFGDRGSEPLFDRRMDYDFFRALGMRLGQENDWPWETYEQVLEHRIHRVPELNYQKAVEDGVYMPYPLHFEKYKEILPNGQTRGFATTSRKAEIFLTLYQELGYDPMPFYRELETPLGNPEMAKEYPLRCTVSGRITPMYHSEQRVPGYGNRSQFPWPITRMHMYDAKKLGIRSGEWIWIESARGRIKQKVQLGYDVPVGVVQVAPSWYYPELPTEAPWSMGEMVSAGNVLIDDSIETCDAATGVWNCRSLLVKCYPCIDPADRADTEISLDAFMKGDTYWHRQFGNLHHLNETYPDKPLV